MKALTVFTLSIVFNDFLCYSCDNSVCETCEEADDDEGDLDDVSCDCLFIDM